MKPGVIALVTGTGALRASKSLPQRFPAQDNASFRRHGAVSRNTATPSRIFPKLRHDVAPRYVRSIR